MATKLIQVHQDFGGVNQIKNVLVDVRSADPSSPAEGQVWYNSTSQSLKYKDAGVVRTLSSSGGVVNAFATITDGTNNATASGADTFKLRVTGTGLSMVVANNDATHGDNALFTLDSATSGNNKVLLTNGSGKIANSVVSEVIATTDLSDVSATTGSGTTLVLATGPTLTNPIIGGTASNSAGALAFVTTKLIVGDGTTNHAVVTEDQSQTLTNKTLTTPTIADLTNATHNHTNAAGGGTLTHAAISDFDTQVRTSRLDQMATPTGSLSLGSQKITNLADGSANTDAVTVQQLNSAIAGGVKYKGTADASQSTVTLATGTGTWANGDQYRITVAGSTAFGFQVNVGDFVIYNGTTWNKIDSTDPGVTGTANRITVTPTGDTNYQVDISTSYAGQATITTLGTIGTGTWQGSSIATTYTDAKLKTLTGTTNQITIGGTATDPTVAISTGYVGQTSITTLGTITTGTWQGTAVGVAYGGTGAADAPTARSNLNAAGIYTALFGNASATSFSFTYATHGLAGGGTSSTTRFAYQVAVYDVATGVQEDVQVTVATAGSGTITIDYNTAPGTNAKRIVING